MTTEVEMSICIIDFGSQFTQLIARRIRELGVFSELVSHKKIKSLQIKSNVKGIILSGGPLNVYQLNNNSFDKKILNLGIPILGICFGHQILSKFNEIRLASEMPKQTSTLLMLAILIDSLTVLNPLSVPSENVSNKSTSEFLRLLIDRHLGERSKFASNEEAIVRSPSGVINTIHTPVDLEEHALNTSKAFMLSRKSSPSVSEPIEQLNELFAPCEAAALRELAMEPPAVLDISFFLNLLNK